MKVLYKYTKLGHRILKCGDCEKRKEVTSSWNKKRVFRCGGQGGARMGKHSDCNEWPPRVYMPLILESKPQEDDNE